jgi:hypothetical protein
LTGLPARSSFEVPATTTSPEDAPPATRAFARLELRERIRLLRALRTGYVRVAPATVEASCRAKGIAPGTPLEGEEWALGPWPVLRHLRLLIKGLSALERRGERTPRVVLILGGGNVAAIPCLDVLTKLFNEGKACVLKMHPVNAYLGPLLEQAFAEAIARNFLRIVYGDAKEGAYLALHPGIDEIHLTGSAATHDNLLWGDDAETRAAGHDRALDPAHHPVVPARQRPAGQGRRGRAAAPVLLRIFGAMGKTAGSLPLTMHPAGRLAFRGSNWQ